ncbi:bile acid:sodium symporter [soil metagenome]
MSSFPRSLLATLGTMALFVGAIVAGSALRWRSPDAGARLGDVVNVSVLALVVMLFFDLRIARAAPTRQEMWFLSVAWIVNFLVIPTLGFAIASLFLRGGPLLFTGLVIYFMATCTDWFLGFTRLAGGNTRLGSMLIPINMATQLLMFPLYLALFAREEAGVNVVAMIDTLVQWFFIPFSAAIIARFVLSRLLPVLVFERLLLLVSRLIPLVIAAIIVQIFAANIGVMLDYRMASLHILLAVFAYFAVTYVLGEQLSRFLQLEQPGRVLLTMTTAARNAPLMLAVTAIALPDQPLIYATIVIGMLIEFPHLTALQVVLSPRKEGVFTLVASESHP